jgi:methanogenic corrinoid protein MtbC1
MIPEFELNGNLPRGRFCATVKEVQDVLVQGSAFATSTRRDRVWADFLTVVDLIKRKRVRVPAALIGGGFVTSTLDPKDVDAAILIDVSRITSPDTLTAVLKSFATRKRKVCKSMPS